MNNKSIIFSVVVSAFASFGIFAQCSYQERPPADKPANFNINENLKKFSNAGKAISKLPNSSLFGPTMTRYSLMASLFYTGREYDIKNNPKYNSGADKPDEFGNWFYGAASHQLGLSKSEALVAGAVVQQYQDFNNAKNENYGSISELAYGIGEALINGNGFGDNHTDSADISSGYDYSMNVYDKDTESRRSSGNSCDPYDSSPGVSVRGYSGGWNGYRAYFGVGGCIGNCNIPRGVIRITDFPSNTKDNRQQH